MKGLGVVGSFSQGCTLSQQKLGRCFDTYTPIKWFVTALSKGR